MKFFNNSTNNDQWIIREVFPGKKNGFFVECGAVDGIGGSSCYALERYLGWNGICIEGHPKHIQNLKRNRKAKCLNVLLSNVDKKDHLYVYFENNEQRSRAVASREEYYAMLEKFHEEYKNQQETLSPKRKHALERMLSKSELLKIKSSTLETVLNKCNAPKIIDYLSIDIEGYEYNVLKNFPFDEYKIMALSVEGGSCDDLLISKGYKHVKNPYNIDRYFENYFLHSDYVRPKQEDYGRKILVVSPTPTHHQNAGNRARIHSMLMSLKKLGHEIHFLNCDREYTSSHVKSKIDMGGMLKDWDKVINPPIFALSPNSFLLKEIPLPFSSIKSNAWKVKKPFYPILGNLWRIKQPFQFLAWLVKSPYYLISGNLWKFKKPFYPIISRLWWLKKPFYFIAWPFKKLYYLIFGKLWIFKKPFQYIYSKLWVIGKFFQFITWPIKRLYHLIRGNLWHLKRPIYPIKGNLWRIRYVYYWPKNLTSRIIRNISPSLYWKIRPHYRRLFKGNIKKAATAAEPKTEVKVTNMDLVVTKGPSAEPASVKPVEIQAENPPIANAPVAEEEISQIDEWYDFKLDKFVKKLHKKHEYDAVIAEYVFMSCVLNNFDDDVVKIIDTHDIFTNRNEKYKKKGLSDTFFTTTAEEEAKGLNRADKIIAIQDEERKFFETLTEKEVITIGHTVKLDEPKDCEKTNTNILYLGTGNVANIHGVNAFIKRVLPLILEEIPGTKLILAGHICKFIKKHDGVVQLGEVKDVQDAYKQADIVINPSVVGTGLKIKNIEAMGLGKILVTSSHSAEGLKSDTTPFLTADSPNEFANPLLM